MFCPTFLVTNRNNPRACYLFKIRLAQKPVCTGDFRLLMDVNG